VGKRENSRTGAVAFVHDCKMGDPIKGRDSGGFVAPNWRGAGLRCFSLALSGQRRDRRDQERRGAGAFQGIHSLACLDGGWNLLAPKVWLQGDEFIEREVRHWDLHIRHLTKRINVNKTNIKFLIVIQRSWRNI
jgi:hypothetical protein